MSAVFVRLATLACLRMEAAVSYIRSRITLRDVGIVLTTAAATALVTKLLSSSPRKTSSSTPAGTTEPRGLEVKIAELTAAVHALTHSIGDIKDAMHSSPSLSSANKKRSKFNRHDECLSVCLYVCMYVSHTKQMKAKMKNSMIRLLN